jgi:hypothetical protein
MSKAFILSAAEIARTLTPAQCRMLVEIDRGQPRQFALGRAGFKLIDLGLAFVNELGARHLTDRGLAVRREIIKGGEG